MQIYFCRTIHGLEELAWADIQAQVSAKLIKISHRSIEFESSVDPKNLLKLRSVDDVFLLLGRLSDITHERICLGRIRDAVAKINFRLALEIKNSLAPLREPLKFSVTASFLGKRNYNRWELAESVGQGIAKNYSWEFVDTRLGQMDAGDLHVRLHLDHNDGLLGARLSTQPLYKRNYKVEHEAGSLNPSLAYLMLKLAKVEQSQSVLDPACGVGTIPIEASLLGADALGLDFRLEGLTKARLNSAQLKRIPSFIQADQNYLPLIDKSFNAVVSDLPWGHQTERYGRPELDRFISELCRVSKPGFTWILLNESFDALETAARSHFINCLERFPISLNGRHPYILKFVGN